MKNSALETIMGAVVLIVAGYFLVFAAQTSDLGTGDGYELVVSFTDATGLSTGGDVRVAGVKVGSIIDVSLDPQTYLARATITIDESIDVPLDSAAEITSEGILGDSFLSISLGNEPEFYAPGEVMAGSSNPDLFELIGQAIYSVTGQDDSSGNGG